MVVELLNTEGVGSLATALNGALTKAEILAYMRGCPVVLSARTRVPDRLDPDGASIPLAWYSDGVFAWTAETIAYIDRYDVAVSSHFVEHVARTGTAPTVLSYAQRESVRDSILAAASPRVVGRGTQSGGRSMISQRLADWLLTVAMEYDPDTAAKLGNPEVYPWLHEELSTAIESGALDGEGLLNWTGWQLGDEGADSDLRMLWGDVFPDRPFPQR